MLRQARAKKIVNLLNLKKIRNMKESGVISQEEYDQLRKKILEKEYK